MTTPASILPPPSDYRSAGSRRSRSHTGTHRSLNVTGMLPQTFMWLPIGLALLAASVILFWLVSRPGFPPNALAAPPANAGDAISPPHEAQNHSAIEILSPVFSAEVQSWRSDILRWSNIYNLDPDLIAAVMQIESCGHPSVLSSAGAIGLFQVMPFHFQAGEDPFDPETNARRGLG